MSDARAALFYAAVRWLQRQAKQPILLVLDDLHWADADSLALIGVLARRIERLPVGILAAVRPWPPAATELATMLAADSRAVVESLGPLSADAAEQLLHTRLDATMLDRELTDRALGLTAGNPLLLEQAALMIRRGGVLPEGGGEYELLTPRITALSVGTRRFAESASVLGLRFRSRWAAKLAELEPEPALDAVIELTASGLVRSGEGGALTFVHPLFRQALYDGVAEPVRQQMHAKAFSVLEAAGARSEAAEQAVVGDLFGDAAAIEVLANAGRDAMRAGAVATAARLLRSGARLAGERAATSVLLDLAEAELLSGDPAATLDICHRILAGSPEVPADAVNALRLLGRACFFLGNLAESDSRYQEAVERSESDDPAFAAEVALEHATVSLFAGGPGRSLPSAVRAREVASGAGTGVRAAADLGWGMQAFMSGDPSGLDVARRGADVVVSRGLTDRAASLGFFGTIAACAEDFDAADSALKTALAWAERTGDPIIAALLSTTWAMSLLRRGRLTEALERVVSASALGDVAPGAVPLAVAVEATILFELGKADEAQRLAGIGQRLAEERHEWLPLLWLDLLAMRRALASGHAAEAAARADHLSSLAATLDLREPALVPWAGTAMAAYAAAGRGDAVGGVISGLQATDDSGGRRWPAAMILRGRALLADIEGNVADACGHYTEAARLSEHLPIERIELLCEHGALLRRDNQPVAARTPLGEALQLAEVIHAARLASVAQEELALAGGRRRRRRDENALTAAEERVAALAADGLTNAEIAGSLFISRKTVDTHLQHIYQKLGINSRRDLMRRAFSGNPSHDDDAE